MSALSRLLRPLHQAASVFFTCDLTLRRSEQGVQVVLQERASAAGGKAPPSRSELARLKQEAEFALMREQLRALLDELPETRRTLRHLVFVEQALAGKGLRALHKLPLETLRRALEQFEGLVTNWSPVGLAGLRSKMAVAIIDRGRQAPDAESEAEADRTAAVLDDEPDVTSLPEVEVCAEDEALAAAYAALGNLAPLASTAELQGELSSPSARAVAPSPQRSDERVGEIRLRELHD